MNFFKPKFWDKNKITLFSVLLFPVSLLVKLFSLIKKHSTISKKISIPVICIGNIYLGGTGKTPLCIEVFSILKSLNMNPAFIRKKYEAFQDEADMQKKIGPIYQNTKRADAIEKAIKNKVNVAILDDGFQDFSIKKDLSIVCFNEKQWIGNGFVIPAGPLRETLSALKRAHCAVINGKKNTDMEKHILNQNKKIKIFYTNYKPNNIHEFENKNVIAFAGIGNPENFFDLLEDYRINVGEKISFPDHHIYSDEEIKNLLSKIKKNNDILLTTEKDYLRINKDNKKDINYLKIKVEIENKNQFIEEIKKII